MQLLLRNIHIHLFVFLHFTNHDWLLFGILEPHFHIPIPVVEDTNMGMLMFAAFLTIEVHIGDFQQEPASQTDIILGIELLGEYRGVSTNLPTSLVNVLKRVWQALQI